MAAGSERADAVGRSELACSAAAFRRPMNARLHSHSPRYGRSRVKQKTKTNGSDSEEASRKDSLPHALSSDEFREGERSGSSHRIRRRRRHQGLPRGPAHRSDFVPRFQDQLEPGYKEAWRCDSDAASEAPSPNLICGSRGCSAPVTLKLDGVHVLRLLGDLIASQSIGYRCLVADGHVLVIPEEPRLSLVVSGVEAEDLPRFPAARRLVEHFAVLDEFKHLGVFGGGLLGTSLFTERVSLSKSAMVLEHLVELLGDDSAAFFVIERASTGVEYLAFGSTAVDEGDSN